MHFGKRNIFHQSSSQNINQNHNNDGNEQQNTIKVAHILRNRQVCFANQKLPRSLPIEKETADLYLDVINTFIMFLNHNNHNRNVIIQDIV